MNGNEIADSIKQIMINSEFNIYKLILMCNSAVSERLSPLLCYADSFKVFILVLKLTAIVSVELFPLSHQELQIYLQIWHYRYLWPDEHLNAIKSNKIDLHYINTYLP